MQAWVLWRIEGNPLLDGNFCIEGLIAQTKFTNAVNSGKFNGRSACLGDSPRAVPSRRRHSYNKNNGATLEATDSKVMPRCRVDYEPGERWNTENTSYTSYDICYQAQDIQLDTEGPGFRPLQVKIGMGINLRPSARKKPLPQISFVNRHQVLIWVSDPTFKAGIRGIMVLMSSYLDSIRTEEELSILHEEQIELGTGVLPKTQTGEHEPGVISLSIAQVQKQSAPSSNKLRAVLPSFFTKMQRPAVTPLADISLHEYLARGWDATNDRWRNVAWTPLDKDLRAAAYEGRAPVWKIQCPWKNTRNTTGTNPAP
ncbi:hypothetical protein K438DRAFT_1871296 [Mycena galopus ATCC 62051]|nr:hypothetical protein K438DRAFT_1871296 [Mycena galopus ATCC 62051]